MSIALTVKKREVFGNRVKSLYRDGLIIGNVFGRGQTSVPIEGDYEIIRKVVVEAGKNHAIELKIEGEGDHLVLERVEAAVRTPATGTTAANTVQSNVIGSAALRPTRRPLAVGCGIRAARLPCAGKHLGK